MIKRFFYPIGQGAFYAEKHPDFTIVYDCGNLKNTSAGNVVIKQAFNSEEVIDILFISHLDYDHISKIDKLKSQVKAIKCVILPLLQDDEKSLLLAINKCIYGNKIATLIDPPKRYFGNDTKVVFVKETENYETIDERDPIPLDDLSDEIKSGTKIAVNQNWVLIPFNPSYDDRHSKLIDKLNDAGYNTDELINNCSETISKLSDTKERKKLKDFYTSLPDGINTNSMLLYSGPWQDKRQYRKIHIGTGVVNTRYYWHRVYRDYPLNEEVGCIYTGDTNLKKVPIKTIFQRYMDFVGTIQIPHHGSVHSFDVAQIKEGIICPISTDTESFGHPSFDVISDLYGNGCVPICVTDNIDSILVEIIN